MTRSGSLRYRGHSAGSDRRLARVIAAGVVIEQVERLCRAPSMLSRLEMSWVAC